MAGPFDVAIRQFLENLQTTPQAVETGFARQREERLIGEERDEAGRIRQEAFQRQDQLREEDFTRDDRLREEDFTREDERYADAIAREDYVHQRDRENQLTDAAVQIRMSQLEQLRRSLGFLEPGSDVYNRTVAAINALARPSQLRGQAFLDHAVSGRLALGAGEVVNLNHLLGETDSYVRTAQQAEAWFETVMENTMNFITNTEIDPELRAQHIQDVVLSSNMFSPQQKEMLLAGVIHDPDARQRVITSGRMDAVLLETAEVQRDLMGVQLKREMLNLPHEQRMNQLEYESMQLQIATQVQNNRLTNAHAFREFGYVPEDDEAAAALASSLGMSVEHLRSMGDRIWRRVQRSEDLAVKGQEIANLHGDVMVAHAQFNLEEDRRLSDINYDTASASLRAIVRRGELELVEAHRMYGYVPTDEEEAQTLMSAMGYSAPEQMQSAGQTIWRRLQQTEEAQLESIRISNAFGKVQRAQALFDLQQGQRLSEITYRRAQEELNQLVETGQMNMSSAFLDFGYVPTDDARAHTLARTMGYENVWELRRAGTKIFHRLQRMENAQVRIMGLNEDLLAAQVEGAEIENAIAAMERDRTAVYAAIEDQANLTSFAFGAATMGDFATIAVLEGMAELEEHADTLGLIDFNELRTIARDVYLDSVDARVHAARQRELEAAEGAMFYTASLDEFLEHTGATFMHSEITPGPDGVSELERDVNAYVDNLPNRHVEALGVSKDVLKERLIAAAFRQLDRQDRENGSVMLDTLSRTIPDTPEARARWNDQFQLAAAMAGFPDEFASSVAEGLLDESTRTVTRANVEVEEIRRRSSNLVANTQATYAEMGLIPYRQSLLHQQARLTGAQAGQLEYELTAAELTEEGALIDKDTHGMLLANANAMRSAANDIITSPICRLQADEFAGRDLLNRDEPMCVAAMEDFEAATENIRNLNNAVLTQDGRYLMRMVETGDPGLMLTHTWETLESMPDVNWTAWNQLPPEMQHTLLIAATLPPNDPDYVPLEEINDSMAEAMGQLRAQQETEPPVTLETLNVNSREWMNRPWHEKVSRLASTPEWQELVDRVVHGREIGTEEADTLAKQFGFVHGFELIGNVSVPLNANIPEFRQALNASVEAARSALEVAPEPGAEQHIPVTPDAGPAGRPAFVPPPLGGGATTGATSPAGATVRTQNQTLDRLGLNLDSVQVPEGVNMGALFDALVHAESGGQHRGVAGAGVEIGPNDLTRSSAFALGLTQIMPETALSPGFGVTPLIPREHRPEMWGLLNRITPLRTKARNEGLSEEEQGQLNELVSEFNEKANAALNDVSEADFARYGYEYLAALLRRYDGQVQDVEAAALAAYHAGFGSVDTAIAQRGDQWVNHIESDIGPLTRNYVTTIMRRLQ